MLQIAQLVRVRQRSHMKQKIKGELGTLSFYANTFVL